MPGISENMTDHRTMTDDELYSLYLKGDGASGDELMLRYADVLTGYVEGFVDDYHEAEDIMIDSFATILVGKPKINEGNFKAYLFKVARNKACHLWKRRYKINEFSLSDDETAEELISEAIGPEGKMLNDERAQTVGKCLNRIAPQYREALWLVYCMDLSHEQAAEILKCNKKKINNLVTNGKAALKKELEKEEI